MPQVDVPNQFGDATLSRAEAAAACGPAAAVAFARANGRNPTLREAVDLAKRPEIGWTEQGGMNGVQNQKKLLDAMGIPAELDTNASPDGIRQRVQAGQDVTVSTPIHYYVVDAVDRQGRVHVGQSGLARRGGAEWMTLEDIAARDGGINGALYQTVSNETGGQQSAGGAGVDPQDDRTKGGQERATGVAPRAPPPTRVSKMQTRIDELQRARSTKADQVEALLKPRPEETAASDKFGDVTPAEKTRADAARQNRETELSLRRAELSDIDKAITGLQTDLANDPDAKPGALGTTTERIVTLPNGTKVKRTYERDPATGAFKPATGIPDEPVDAATRTPNNKTVVTRNGQSFVYDPDTNTFTPAQGLPNETPKTTTHAIGKRLITLDDQGNVVGSQDFTTPAEATAAALANQQAGLNIQKAQRDLLPQQLQIAQGLHETIVQLQQMYEKGQIQIGEMNAFVELAKSAAEAQMRGTTPADEAKERIKAKQADQSLGMGLLNQRLVSGSGLATTLMNAATGPHVMLRPGQQSLGVDPLEGLRGLVDSLGGGPGVGDYARSLLMGAQGPPTAVPPMHAGL